MFSLSLRNSSWSTRDLKHALFSSSLLFIYLLFIYPSSLIILRHSTQHRLSMRNRASRVHSYRVRHNLWHPIWNSALRAFSCDGNQFVKSLLTFSQTLSSRLLWERHSSVPYLSSSRWSLSARESPYVLRPICQKVSPAFCLGLKHAVPALVCPQDDDPFLFSLRSWKPICAPSRLSDVFPPVFCLWETNMQFQCWCDCRMMPLSSRPFSWRRSLSLKLVSMPLPPRAVNDVMF